MAVLTKDQLLAKIKERIGEETSDEALSLIEDVNDTMEDMEKKNKDTTDWEKKYKDNDEAWRKKYRDRFFRGTEDKEDDDPSEPEGEPKKLTYENLFKEEK